MLISTSTPRSTPATRALRRVSAAARLGRRKIGLAVLAVVLMASACSDDPDPQSSPPAGDPIATAPDGSDDPGGTTEGAETTVIRASSGPGGIATSESTITIELSEAGEPSDELAPRPPRPDTTPLSPSDQQALADRADDLDPDAAGRSEFERPPESRPRPRALTVVEQAFPPAGDPPEPPAAEATADPLEVVRYQPEGPIELAPFISVTFNQPMVALGTVDAVEAQSVPITVEPELPGRWIWLGTKTARFEHDPSVVDRIPGATEFVVTIPAGTESATGARLEAATSFSFSTPAARATDAVPMDDSMSTEPIWLIEFNQAVDADAALAASRLEADGETVALTLASDEEASQVPEIERRVERAVEGRFIAVKPADPLPNDAAVRLTVGPGLASDEGQVLSTESQTFSGRTFGALEVGSVRCGWGDRCEPGQAFHIEMTNPLDADAFSADQIDVEPAIPGLAVWVSGHALTIGGRTRGQTTYKVTLDPSLKDTFGQTLGRSAEVEVEVGDARPALLRPGGQVVTLDPVTADDMLRVTSINNESLDVTVYQVSPVDHLRTFYDRSWEIGRGDFNPPWPVLDERSVSTGGEANDYVEVPIDLESVLDETGHVVVIVAPSDRDPQNWQNEPFALWVQRTNLGIDAYSDNAQAVVWVTDLRTGEPRADVDVSIPGEVEARTDSDGIAHIELPINDERSSAPMILAQTDGEQAILSDFWASGWPVDDQARWYGAEDRGIYRPGETILHKGWIRIFGQAAPATLTVPPAGTPVRWTARDAFGNPIDSGIAELNAFGGYNLAIKIPDQVALGPAGIDFSFEWGGSDHSAHHWRQLQIQEFRTPEFEVTTDVGSPEPQLVDETVRIDANAAYFAGGPLPGAEINWHVRAGTATYSPPNWPEFSFGIWVPWWFSPEFGGAEFDDSFPPNFGTAVTEELAGRTDDAGEHALAIDVAVEDKPQPISLTATATVIDINRQPFSSSSRVLVHPSERYVGMRTDRYFVQPDEPIQTEIVVTDIDGRIQAGHEVTVVSERLAWRFEGGSWQEVPELAETCETVSADEPVSCTFEPDQGGRYRLTATTTDDDQRQNLTEITRWVAGGERPPSRRVQLETVELVPDRREVLPGQTAEVLVQAPFTAAHGLLIVTRSLISHSETVEFDENGSATIQIPVTSDDIGGIGVQVEVVGTAPRGDGSEVARPAYATGQLTLDVPADERALAVDVAPRHERLMPGGSTVLDVAVRDASGAAVPDAELLVVVVDEAVLALTGYQFPDPIEAWYQSTGRHISAHRGRAALLLGESHESSDGEAVEETAGTGGADFAEDAAGDDAMMEMDMDMAMEDGAAPEPSLKSARGMAVPQAAASDASTGDPIEVRSDFSALAVFEPEIVTDDQGKATIDVDLPDNLTRYRVMVAAVANSEQAGTGESNVTAQLPISIRPAPPRFANFGDRFEFAVVVQNNDREATEVDLVLEATNLTVHDPVGQTVTVPAEDRVEVRFDVTTDVAGTARYQVIASAGDVADAAGGSFPVYTPATAEAFATYGTIAAGGIDQPIVAPSGVFAQFGGLEVSTSSTAVSALTDAVIDLTSYRHESSSGLASRLLAIAALADLLDAFDAEGLPSATEIRDGVERDLEALARMQNDDGGFPYWRRGRESIPYNSVQATHAMALARQRGFDVPASALDSAQRYLTEIEQRMPDWYSEESRRGVVAYALHVRNLLGDRDETEALALLRESDNPQLDVAAWLWPVLADTEADAEIDRLLHNRVTETANAATFATDYGDQAWVLVHSDRRTDAVVLDALLTQRPDSDLILKTLNGILGGRSRSGRWSNVVESSFALLASGRYFAQFEETVPDFVGRVWVDDVYAAEHSFTGRNTDQQSTTVPMELLVDEASGGETPPKNLAVLKDGEGLLYYRLGLRYAPADFELEPRDQGFVVRRTYEAVDDPDDVVVDADGNVTVTAGARVRVRLTMVADSRRTHVALIDPLPAGFEALNPALATAEPIPVEEDPQITPRWGWWYRWFDHQNLRDDRTEAFATWLGAGVYDYSYVARATTVGTFGVPPARAEQLYEPEVFGRTANTTVTVVD